MLVYNTRLETPLIIYKGLSEWPILSQWQTGLTVFNMFSCCEHFGGSRRIRSPERIIYMKPDSSEFERTKSFPTNKIIGGWCPSETDSAINKANKKHQNSKVNMFLRAQNREFLGMTEAEESMWKGKYEFICMGDPQIGMGDMEMEKEFSRLAVQFINSRKDRIKFVVVCGDHTHNLEDLWAKGDKEGGRKKRVEELKAYKDIYSKLHAEIPLVCVCGNHDVGNKPTASTIKLYSDEFGSDYLTFWSGGVKFIVLNSQIIQGLEPSDTLALQHERWADNQFQTKHDKEPVHTVAICHIPPFCWDAREKETNFNWPTEKRKKWLDKMVEANVKKVYCSHYHRRAGGMYKGLEVVVTGAVGTHIRTKDVPIEYQGNKLDEINFKLSFQGFGGVETNENTSGLQVVTVSKEGLKEEWLTIAQMKKETDYWRNHSKF